jgi:hypothetical protein
MVRTCASGVSPRAAAHDATRQKQRAMRDRAQAGVEERSASVAERGPSLDGGCGGEAFTPALAD